MKSFSLSRLILTGLTILYLSDVPEKSWYSTLPTKNSKAYRLDTLFRWLENTSTLFNTFTVY
jgi:hypothetical protein